MNVTYLHRFLSLYLWPCILWRAASDFGASSFYISILSVVSSVHFPHMFVVALPLDTLTTLIP